MRRTTKFLIRLAVLGFAVAWTGLAGAQPDAQMWETTEEARFLDANRQVILPPFGPGNLPVYREASSALSGTARLGTLWCPTEVLVTRPATQSCTVMAKGTDSVSLVTGQGRFSGRFWVVVQGDNPFDPPEEVVLTGSFGGDIDFSPALTKGLPYGTIDGTVSIAKGKGRHVGQTFALSGIFRQPIAGALIGMDGFVYLDWTQSPPFVVIAPNELVLGAPVPRFDVTFGGPVGGRYGAP
jgi:hypothetical protein